MYTNTNYILYIIGVNYNVLLIKNDDYNVLKQIMRYVLCKDQLQKLWICHVRITWQFESAICLHSSIQFSQSAGFFTDFSTACYKWRMTGTLGNCLLFTETERQRLNNKTSRITDAAMHFPWGFPRVWVGLMWTSVRTRHQESLPLTKVGLQLIF